MRHLPHHTKLTGLTAFFAFAHHLQNHIVLCGVAVAGGEAGVPHPLVFTAKMVIGVVNQGLPCRQKVVVRGLDHGGQQVNKFMVCIVHER